MSKPKGNNDLKPEHKRFAEEYVIDWNGTRAYQAAYPKASYDTARANQSKLLANTCIQDYISEIQKDLSKLTGVTAARNILELKKIAYSSMADLKKDWYSLEDYEDLPKEVKDAIFEVQHTETTFGEDGKKEQVKVKMHDKQRAIEILNKMLGFNEPNKTDLNVTGDGISINYNKPND